jgi:ABC-type sugar transport system ATPase subunit
MPRPGSSHDEVLLVRDLVKVYPPAMRALDHFSLTLREGEIHGLAGVNGAGKSTAIKILTGVEPATSGRIELSGVGALELATPADAFRLGIGVVHQELPLLPNLTAAENVVLGVDGRRSLGRVSRRDLRREYDRAAERFPSAPPADARMEELGLYAWQSVAIVRALRAGARLLILDEPTSSLNTDERETLHHNLREVVRTQGVPVLYVSHFLDDVLDISDTVTVVRDGRVVACEPAASLTERRLLQHMLGEDFAALEAAAGAGPAAPAEDGAAVAPEVPAAPGAARRRIPPAASADDGLHLRGVRAGGVGPVSLEVAIGERVGLYGLQGSGAPELLQAIFGLRPHGGQILWRGRGLPRSTRGRIDRGLGLVSGDRKRTLIGEWTVAANHGLPWYGARAAVAPHDRGRERDAAARTVGMLDVKGAPDHPLRTLSGGNQQKVSLGRWLTRDGVCLLADEPTHGVDAHGRASIHRLLVEQSSRHTTLLVHSTDPEELVALCDRVLTMSDGRVTGSLAGAGLSVDALESATRSLTRHPSAA